MPTNSLVRKSRWVVKTSIAVLLVNSVIGFFRRLKNTRIFAATVTAPSAWMIQQKSLITWKKTHLMLLA